MIDYSFIRLKPTLNDALNIGDSPLSQFIYYNQIHLLPNENYLQISNLDSGISFDGDFKAELIDCEDNLLADITSNFGVYEFIDKNGVNQIAFEFAQVGLDFGFQAISLKLTHTTGNEVYYSNPFILTDEFSYETTRFDYKSYGYFNGISYDKVSFYQSIRLNFWFDNVENKTEVSDYYQISNGNTISNRALYKQSENYKSEYINRFSFERTNILLISDVVYAEGVRITNKPQASSNDRLGYSNLFESSFNCFKNYNDTFDWEYQIVEKLSLIDKVPLGIYTLASLPNSIIGTFNKNIVKNVGTIELLDKDTDSLLVYYTEDDFVIVDNVFTIDITGVITSNGNYYIKISNDLFYSGLEIFEGIDNNTEWSFRVADADFLGTDFNNDDFFTN